jgi:hypothetical protein
MKEESIKRLIASGCTILKEPGKIYLSCPTDILKTGIKVSGFPIVRVKEENGRINLYFEKEVLKEE